MLEEIHATPEDRRKAHVIVALAVVAAGVYAVLDGVLGIRVGVLAVGAALTLGVPAAVWLAEITTRRPRRA